MSANNSNTESLNSEITTDSNAVNFIKVIIAKLKMLVSSTISALLRCHLVLLFCAEAFLMPSLTLHSLHKLRISNRHHFNRYSFGFSYFSYKDKFLVCFSFFHLFSSVVYVSFRLIELLERGRSIDKSIWDNIEDGIYFVIIFFSLICCLASFLFFSCQLGNACWFY